MSQQGKSSIEGKNIVDSNGIKVWKMRAMLLFMFFMLLTGTLLVSMPLLSLILGLSSLVMLIILNLFFLPRLYERLSVICQNNRITVYKGYYNRRKIQVRFSSIEYLILSKDFIEKFYGVCTVYVLMAGHTVILWELSSENALELERMVRYYQEHPDERSDTDDDISPESISEPFIGKDVNKETAAQEEENRQPVLYEDDRYG